MSHTNRHIRVALIALILMWGHGPALTWATGVLTPAATAPSLKVQDVDGTPSVNVNTLKFTNGTVTDNADGTATVTIPGAGSVTSVDAANGVETVSGSPITATGTIRAAELVNAQTGTTYTYLTGDRGKLVTHTNAAAIAGTLPQASASFPSGWYMDVQNRGAGTLTITPTTSTIDGAASLALTTNQGVRVVSDGTNYFTQRGVGAAGIGGTVGTTDNRIPRSDGVGGATLQASGVTIDDSNNVTIPGNITVGSGAGPSLFDMLEGTAPGANATASHHNCYIDSTSSRWSCHENGGSVADYVTAAATQTLTNKSLDAEGTGNVLTVPRRLWFPAAGCNNATAGSIWDLPAASFAVAACITGTNTQKGVLDFADAASLSAQITYKLPSTWSGTVDANIKWLTTAITGDVVWQLATICVADAETDDPAFNTASTVTDTAKGTTNQTNDAAITTVTVTGCAAGELLHVKILRDSAHASDTLAATARLIGVELVIREAI